MELRPIGPGEDIVPYSADLAGILFEGRTRKTGLPYTQAHFAKVAELVDYLLLASPSKPAAVGASWLHDAPEDIDYIDVFSPMNNHGVRRRQGIVYLNDLFADAGELGQALCHIVDRATHRIGIPYQEYIQGVFNLARKNPKRILDVKAAVLKVADRHLNTNPNERLNLNALAQTYLSIPDADEEALKAFLEMTKTKEAFDARGNYDKDVALLLETLMEAFRSRQRARAADNLSQYLPLAERRLLAEIHENNGIFDWRKLSDVLKRTYLDSFEVAGANLGDVQQMDASRDLARIPGYNPILREIQTITSRP